MAYTTIDDPSAHHQTVLYSGNGGSNAITFGGNSDMQPDWVWIKCRSNASTNHYLWDSSRGVTKYLSPSQDIAESADAASLTAFGSDGFTMGDGGAEMNNSGRTYIGWGWKCNGGSTTSGGGTDSIATSTYQANTTAGFSIVTYTGEASAKTVAHGLGVKPNVIIVKCRQQKDWHVYFDGGQVSDPETDYLRFNTNLALTDNDTSWNDTAPTTSVFTIGSGSGGDANGNTDTFVAYCFANIQGYSKFGSYTGNGNADGPFVYTGFKPAYLVMKETTGTGNWAIIDSTRSTHNVGNHTLAFNSDGAESAFGDGASVDGDYNRIDLLSNGFKIRDNSAYNNNDGDKFVYMAFAEQPFVSSKGVPCPAR